MISSNLIEASTTTFKIGHTFSDPVLIVATGLTGAEAITLDTSNVNLGPGITVDPTNDTLWTALISAAAQIQLDVNNNYFFIQAPAYYRFVLGSVPASPITLTQFVYK